MTLDEKVGQLVQSVGMNDEKEDLIRSGSVGSVLIGLRGAEYSNSLQKIAVEESRLGIPLLFANDIIHGYHTIFPIPLGEASSWNPELVKEASSIVAFESASEGTHWTYAPMVDITRDPRWGRIMEGSGEDPFLGKIMAMAKILGFQGDDLKDKTKIAPGMYKVIEYFEYYGSPNASKYHNARGTELIGVRHTPKGR